MKIRSLMSFFPAAAVFAAMLAVAGLTGCRATSGIEASGKVDEAGFEKKIVINNRGLSKEIEITDIKSTFVGDIMKVQVSLHSKDRDTVPVQYRFDWFDAQGFDLNANQAWKPFLLYGKEVKVIQGVAPDQRAKEFKLKLRDPDEQAN